MADQPTNHRVDNPAGNGLGEDALLKAALLDVPLPAGLGSRLKSRIRLQYETSLSDSVTATGSATLDTRDEPLNAAIQASTTASSIADEADSTIDVVRASIASESDLAKDEPAGRWVRRSFLLAALAAGICGFAYLARQWTRPAEPTWLASHCDSILVQIDNDNPANWRPVTQPVSALARVQSQLVRMAVVAERPLTALGSKLAGTVYRLDAGDGRAIFLMRLESLPAVRGLTSRFEILPTPSGGWSLAAMTTGKETYVLAANCTEQQIFTYIRRLDLT